MSSNMVQTFTWTEISADSILVVEGQKVNFRGTQRSKHSISGMASGKFHYIWQIGLNDDLLKFVGQGH